MTIFLSYSTQSQLLSHYPLDAPVTLKPLTQERHMAIDAITCLKLDEILCHLLLAITFTSKRRKKTCCKQMETH